MKLFPISNQYAKSTQNLIDNKNCEINAFKHYIDDFSPNYKILNETPCFMTTEELISGGYIAPAFVGDKNSPLCLIIFASRLQYNEGLLQNFYAYESAYVYMGKPEDLSNWKDSTGVYIIPRNMVSGEEQLSYSGDLMIQTGEADPQYIFSLSDGDVGTLSYRQEGNFEEISYDELKLESYYPVNVIFSFSSEAVVAAQSQIKELEFSNYFISKMRTEGSHNPDHKDWTKFSNYQLIRLAQGGGYYSWFVAGSQHGMEATLTYNPKATDSMGIKYLLSGNLYQKRFYFQYIWAPSDFKNFPSFREKDNGSLEFLIKTLQGSPWLGSELLNHEFILPSVDNNNNYMEQIFLDDTRETTLQKTNKRATPTYNITVQEGIKIKLKPTFSLW